MKLTMLKTFSVVWLFGMYVVLLLTFLAAFQNPDKTVTVAINLSNEAVFEFYMLTGTLFITTLGTMFIISDIKKDYSRRLRDQGFITT
jgi:hypothetical protein